MVRIGTGSRPGPAQVRPAPGVSAPDDPKPAQPTARALVAIVGGGSERDGGSGSARRAAAGQARAGFLAQLIVADDPTLRPSRRERSRMAAACYAEAARRLA
jgi:hypothetical protein